MQKRARIIGIVFCLVFHHTVLGQVTNSFSGYFDQFYQNYYLHNPANTDSAYKLSAYIAHDTQTGLFQGVSRTYMDADVRLYSGKNLLHFVGVQAVTNREGEFIRKRRLLGRYSLRIRLSYRSSLSAGICGGFVNYSFSTSQAGTGGAAWVPDGNAGLWYLRPKLAIGISMQQALDQRIKPVNQFFYLNRYYNINARYRLPVSTFLNLATHFYIRFQKDQPTYFACVPLVEIQNILEVGAGYSYRRGFSYVAGIKKLSIGRSSFSFSFSYFVSSGRMYISDNAVELMISYRR
jgi:type IX secretion system PorP/SprF family membrane protein